jgi:hypothetical protein
VKSPEELKKENLTAMWLLKNFVYQVLIKATCQQAVINLWITFYDNPSNSPPVDILVTRPLVIHSLHPTYRQ